MKAMTVQKTTKITESKTSGSYARHRRQKLWQIILPVGLGVVLILAALGMVIYTAVRTPAGQSVSQWADVSMIWLIIPALFIALVIAAVLFTVVWLLTRLLKILPQYTSTAQYYVGIAVENIRSGADKVVMPFIAGKGFVAKVSELLSRLVGRHRT
jgi:heme/copper-type cytochrome/quinol oxidase subunit 2